MGYSPVGPPQRNPEFARNHHQSSLDATAIDPALIGYPGGLVSDYQPSTYNQILAQSDQLYTQNYEKYHTRARNISQVLYQPTLANIHDIPTRRDSFSLANTKQIHSSLQIEEKSGNGDGFDRPPKRSKYNYASQVGGRSPFLDLPLPLSTHSYVFGMSNTPIVPGFPVGTPLTPTSSLADNEDGYKSYSAKLSPHTTHGSPDPRRLSVESLLSGPPGIPYQHSSAYGSGLNADTQVPISASLGSDITEEMTTWGVDMGFPDLDIGKNVDANAVSGGSPLLGRDSPDPTTNDQSSNTPIEFGFGVQAKSTEFQKGNYYARSVLELFLLLFANKIVNSDLCQSKFQDLLSRYLRHCLRIP